MVTTNDYLQVGQVQSLWDDLIAPRGITLKIKKEREITAQELLDE